MADRRLIIVAILVVVIVVVLAGVAVYYLTLRAVPGGGPLGTNTCTGTKAYSGIVQNDTQVPVPGAVVSLKATPPNVGTNAIATTDANGLWSATVSSVCAYTARVYWQSATDSPLLAMQVNVSASSTVTVHVAWQTIGLTLMSEFPHSASANVTVTIPDGFSFFVEANSSGSIPLGFLPTDPAGSPGYPFTISGSFVSTGSSPYTILFSAARAYRIQDANGISVVYAKPVLQGGWGGNSATDPLTMAAAIAQVQARGGIPYVQVAGHGSMTLPFSVTNATHVLAGSTPGIYGVTLQDYVTVPTNSTLFLGISVQLVNTGNRNACFVVDPEGTAIHTWYYAAGNCP